MRVTIAVVAILVSSCLTSEGGGGSGGSTAKTCDAVCPKVVKCWIREAGEDAVATGYGGTVGYLDAYDLGDFNRNRYREGYCDDGYGYGGYGECSIEEVENSAVEMCLRGCYDDLEHNQGMIACIAEQSCPTLLSVCLGADFSYGY